MPIVRLYPDGTVSNDIPSSGMTGGGSIPAHTLLGDQKLLTYMRQVHSGIGTLTRLDMQTYTLQTNERIAGIRVGMIKAHTHPMGVYALINDQSLMGAGTWSKVPFFDLAGNVVPIYRSPWFPKNTATGLAWTQANLNALQLYVHWLNPGGTFDARLYEIWIDVDVQTQAVPVNVDPEQDRTLKSNQPGFRWAIPSVDGYPNSQRKYDLKVFTKAVVEGGGYDPDVSVEVARVIGWRTSILASGPWGTQALRALNPVLNWGDDYYWTVKAYVLNRADNTEWASEWSEPTPFKVTEKPAPNILEPIGTITTNLPLLVWENADPELDPQAAFQIRVYQEPGAGWGGFDPNTTLQAPLFYYEGTDSTQFSLPLTTPVRDGIDYRIYMRTAQRTEALAPWDPQYAVRYQVGPLLWGDWVFEDFTPDFIEPDAPELAAYSFEDRVEIHVTPGTEPAPVDIDYYVIERSLDGGDTWSTFRLGDGTDTSQLEDLTTEFIVTDHEVPYDTEVMYRAFSVSTDLGPGFEVGSLMSNVVLGATYSVNIWIKDTGDSDNNAHFPYTDEWVSRVTKKSRSVHTPLGRSKAIVVKGINNFETINLNLLILGQDQKERITNIIDSNRTLFVCTPKGCWYAEISADVSWLDRMGDARQGQEDVWKVSMTLTEVDG